ncbi:competence protein ComEA helix-hairpin-helix repeat protein [Candidatus Arthromitus sp. SFB-mouse-Japan]|uniref:helix-hairpin-helix domain-containing protein n=1 Tax=Candidatus Arthromitus sp. SFB-mouse TaxID=49118 RepID=UPI00021B7E89|nr:helix-hairpin-helix domain-containing protein [Candidatus Arthromitus sp. SFB-mouse]EIA22382.1 Putative comE operon protein 1 [Candidatus Arthromitus sp. SFB-1]EIA23178.1 Putative comE operon protein 1 [Candidatus Arthromitus sp. SFB-2]EIA25482.1 Putative comE operon protein 1 [Candidatus Arthromitus sp. SFB-3]EIA27829.1 Putative comE operon protein 1 [Candidatus Arthromitus sp. SFB-co]EIA28319.1 Putative comE operon protein 1 [Candidatus Arthromitus sp. SFB-4]EIA30478.1 Putative comE oper
MFKKDNLVKVVSMGIVGIVFLSVFFIYNKSAKNSYNEVVSLNEFIHDDKNQDEIIENNFYLSEEDNIKKTIFVEVKGEVLNPNVYKMEEGSIVYDLILMAGGITDKGSLDDINQAREIKNGECIIVRSIDDEGVLDKQDFVDSRFNETSYRHSGSDNNSFLININTASKEELKTLNGIGDVLADSIIEYREENGVFESIDDIKNVSRIGSKTFEKFRDKITV